MCGISFFWHSDRQAIDRERTIDRMTRAQEHRGPDAAGSRVCGRAAIGHNRLRILDLDPRSDQPFGTPDSSALLSFNGEIYNLGELRTELESLGVAFGTTSDTEVLYHALLEWGVEAIPRLNGMFAFAWFEPESGRLLLARDRIGIKPLYLAHSEEWTIAASEIKGILAAGLFSPRLSAEALIQIIRFNHTLGTTTAFEGIRSIAPGTFTTIDLETRRLESTTYWRPIFRNGWSPRFDDRVRDVDERFRRAVRLQSVADVEVASFMSGGLDSTGLAAEAREVLGENHTTYSMVFPGVPYSEEPAIDRVVSERGDRNRKVPIERVTLEQYADYILSAEMPQWWTTDLALKLLSEGVHDQGHRVAFSGEGPDEFLAGYEVYRLMKIRARLQRLGISGLLRSARIQRGVAAFFRPWYKVDLSMVSYYMNCHDRGRSPELLGRYGFHPENMATWDILLPATIDLMSEGLRDSLPEAEQSERTFFGEQIAPMVEGRSALEANLLFEITQRLPNWILHMSDRVSAAHQVELRLPYLENDLVDAMLQLPESDRIHGLSEKHILKHVHRRRVPSFILKKKKQPLYTPAYDWTRRFAEEEGWERYWSAEIFEEVGFFDFDACEELRRRLDGTTTMTELERLSAEWAFGLVLSTHVLHREMRDFLVELG